MRIMYASRKDMAKSYRLKLAVAKPAFRALQGRRVSRVANARKAIMERKLYQRSGNPKLTRNLIDSEQIRFNGNVAEISNTAVYAQIRNDEEGISKLWGHDKELHFAEGAIAETRAANKADARATMRKIMSK
jgi:hypothetical protein